MTFEFNVHSVSFGAVNYFRGTMKRPNTTSFNFKELAFGNSSSFIPASEEVYEQFNNNNKKPPKYGKTRMSNRNRTRIENQTRTDIFDETEPKPEPLFFERRLNTNRNWTEKRNCGYQYTAKLFVHPVLILRSGCHSAIFRSRTINLHFSIRSNQNAINALFVVATGQRTWHQCSNGTLLLVEPAEWIPRQEIKRVKISNK